MTFTHFTKLLFKILSSNSSVHGPCECTCHKAHVHWMLHAQALALTGSEE